MIELRGATYTYPEGRTLGPLDLRVEPGQLVLLCGPTGCGKSTMLRLAAGLLQRHGGGEAKGVARINQSDPAALVAGERARTLGFVGQDPDDGVVCGTCLDEAAFAAESAGLGAAEIEAAARSALARVGLAGFEHRDPLHLSGGQRQRLVIGAAVSAGARALLLDEPLAHLDPAGAIDVMRLLRTLADDGVAILLVEHRLDVVRPYADAIVSMGELPAPGEPDPPGEVGEVVLRGTGLGYRWGLCRADITVREGDRIAVVGPNGAGKTTLLRLLAGELAPVSGAIEGPRGLLVPQNPDLGLFCETVAEELAYGPREHGRPQPDVAAAFGVEALLDRPPQALSRGQRLRTAVAAAVACEPDVLLLDEPTAGQDADQVERMFAALRGRTVVFATHDLELVRRHATAVVELRDGLTGGEVVVPRVAESPPLPAGGLDARVRLGLLLLLGVLVLCLDRATSLGLCAAGSVVAALAQPRMRGWRLRFLGGVALLAWSTAFSQAIFYQGVPRTPIELGPLTLWREGALHGLVQSLRFVALTAAGLVVALGTSPDRMVGALLRLRVPYGLALMASASLRFVPTVGGELVAVRRARARRGRPVWARSPGAWLRLEAALLLPVMARSIRRARALAESLEVRGFHPTAPRGVRAPLRMNRIDVVVLVGAGVVTIAAVVLRALYLLYSLDLWYDPALREVYGVVRGWV